MLNHRDTALALTILLTLPFFVAEIGRTGEAWAAESLREDTAQLDFVRTDVARGFKDTEVLCENYVVKEGDYIWRILRKRGHGSVGQLTYWGKVLQELNPEVKDLNKIYKGQRLLIPLRHLSEAEGPSAGPPQRPAEAVTDTEARSAGPAKRPTETITVRPGETVVSILRDRLHLTYRQIYDEVIPKVKELNPGIKNLDFIQSGQRLIIPLYQQAEIEERLEPKDIAEARPLPLPATAKAQTHQSPQKKQAATAEEATGPTEVIIDTRAPAEVSGATPVQEEGPDTLLKTRMASSLRPEDQRIQVLADAFMALVVAFGGRAHNSGRHFLPLRDAGQITLKAQSFPMLEFPTGEKIFLDLHDRLLPGLEEAIKANWEGRYSVVNVMESDNFRTVWQRVMEHLTVMEQWLTRDPLLIHTPLQIAIQGDWVLSQPNPQGPKRKIFVVNLLVDSGERTDLAMQAYLDALGVRVVDVQLRGQLERARIIAPLTERAFPLQGKPVVVAPASVQEAVASFLDLFGQRYERETNVPLYSDDQGEVTITVKAGFYFYRQGQPYLINFRPLSPAILRLLEERDLRVLVVSPGWSTTEVFKALITHLGLVVEQSYVVPVSARSPMRNISLSVPGELVKDGEQRYLLTTMAVPASLADFFARSGVRVLSYGNP